jgi:hypothetical protein
VAPASWERFASSTTAAVLLPPIPAITFSAPTASATVLTNRSFSSVEVVGDSPVVPLITRVSVPFASKYRAISTART